MCVQEASGFALSGNGKPKILNCAAATQTLVLGRADFKHWALDSEISDVHVAAGR
jgi:hypothetical protein